MSNYITSIADLQEFVKIIRSYKKGFLTNFFIDVFKHSLWIEHNELFYQQVEQTIFIVRKTKEFDSLFFLSTGIDDLDFSLSIFSKQISQKMVVDIVGNDSVAALRDVFTSYGFSVYTSLHRMSRCGAFDVENNISINVVPAEQEDAVVILQLLQSHFDKFAEQIPSIEEIKKWIGSKSVLTYKRDNLIIGFLIYELIGVTLYLRYWFVNPDCRNLKIGSSLFSTFMYRGKDTKRQLFWVIDSNENAIKRYEHYGFISEKMFDYVLIKNN